MKMPGVNSAAAKLALAAALAVFAACKAVDQAEHRAGVANNAPANKAPAKSEAPPAKQPTHSADDGHGHGAQGEVRRISIEEAQAAAARGEVVYVDVRGADAYRAGHIAGSVLMPNSEIPRRGSQLPKDKLIIFYCA